MKKLSLLLVTVLVFGGYVTLASPALAVGISSDVSLYGTGLAYETAGGAGVASAFLQDTGFEDGGALLYTNTFNGWSLASAQTGQIGVRLQYESSVGAAPQARSGGYGASDPSFRDLFTIGAGTSGLNPGDPVQVRFLASLNGQVVLHGNPSGGSWLGYNAYISGATGTFANYAMPGASGYPEQNFVVNQTWNELLNVNIGDTLILYVSMSMDLNGSTHNPNTNQTNYLDFYTTPATAGLGFAPGFENISIESLAGAPVAPVPVPGSLLLLGSGLLGLIPLRRKFRR